MAAMKVTSLLALFVVVTAAEGPVVPFTLCENVSTTACTIHEVRVDPCREVPRACKIKLGKDAAISFAYTANFNAAKLHNLVETTIGQTTQKLDNLPQDACAYTACPAVRGQRQDYTFNLHISKIWPQGLYTIKWKLWNPENDSEMCCFTIDIKLSTK